MNTSTSPIADKLANTVSIGATIYNIQPLGDDTYTVLVDGIPVGHLVYVFGTATGVPDGDGCDEKTLTLISESWFSALEG